MPALLTTASVLTCPHGGLLTTIPANARASAGAPLLAAGDTALIAGCAFTIAGAPSPCVRVQWVSPATRVTRGGAPVLNEASLGLCLNAAQAPQGAVLIAAGAPSVSGL